MPTVAADEASPVLITGSRGQLGRALRACLPGDRGLAATREQLDLSQPETVRPYLDRVRPGAIWNAAAWTAVDQAESDPAGAARVNAESVGEMARWCAEHGVPWMHFSTDYVFPGSGERAHSESDPTGPLNVYGTTKLDGERRALSAGGRCLVFRTSWVYDAEGKNFFRTLLRLGAEREELRVVEDQVGAPTYAPHLAAACVRAWQQALAMPEFPSGVYHLCGAGSTSWHGFAEAILAEARRRGLPMRAERVVPIPTEAFPTPARRPRNSRLNTERARTILGVELPDWREGLRDCMEAYCREGR